MMDPDFIEQSEKGLLAGGVEMETLTDEEWDMFRRELLGEVFRCARGWATALTVLRSMKASEQEMNR